MNPAQIPWLELAIAVAAVGSLLTSRHRQPGRAYRWGVAFTGASFVCSVLAWLSFSFRDPAPASPIYSIQTPLFGRQLFLLDNLSAPLVPAVSLLHLLAAVATARTHVRRFSYSWSLAAEAIGLATFSTKEPWVLIGLLAASTVPPYVELLNRRRPTRLYVLHMSLFVGLLVFGWAAIESPGPSTPAPWWTCLAASGGRSGAVRDGARALLGNRLVRACVVRDRAALCCALKRSLRSHPARPADRPRVGFAIHRSPLPLHGRLRCRHGRDPARAAAILRVFVSQLRLAGTGRPGASHRALAVRIAMPLVLSDTVLERVWSHPPALEARFGRLSLTEYHGLYEHAPMLAIFFLLTGLASVGFPCTVGFISTELLVDSVVEANLYAGIGVLIASALNGISVLRAYLLLFTGARHASSVPLTIGTRERFAVLTLSTLILLGGIFPQPGVTTREEAAAEILKDRSRQGVQPHRPSGKATIGMEVPPPARRGAWNHCTTHSAGLRSAFRSLNRGVSHCPNSRAGIDRLQTTRGIERLTDEHN